ncbi:hypothetical protein C0J52_05575 [Blattella germanica]|nr:hypothetical protein C0J52_05575 [Blattella germanica]
MKISSVIMCKLCYITTCILATLAVTSGEEYTVIVKSNATLTLTCEADVPIHWCFPATYATPDNSETINYTSPTTINYEYSKTRKHRITIEVKNITYIYTGFYHCVRNDSQNLCNRQMESYMPKYVYVEDFNNIMVVKSFKRIWAPKSGQAVLPCLPTHPNINMTLIKNGIVKVQIQKEYCHEPGQMCKNYTLTINNITSDDAGTYTCMLMSPPMEPEISSFDLHVISNNSDEHENNIGNNSSTNNNINKNSSNVTHFYKRSSNNVHNIDNNDFQQTSDDFIESHHKSMDSSGNFVIPLQQNIISIFVLQFIIGSYLHFYQ